LCIIAADALGLPLEKVRFQLGDSTLPVAPVEGGSSHVATVGSAVQGVCEKLQQSLFKIAKRMAGSPFAKCKFTDVQFADGMLEIKGQGTALALTAILAASGEARLEEKYMLLPAVLKQRKFVRATHSAVFAEVRVDEELGLVRVTRVVSAIAAGRIINAKAARSQIIGGVVWGISQGLHEETQTDHTLGRFMNHNLAEYHVAVNADIHDIDVIFVNEDDRIVSRLGAKGVGEIGQLGVAAAIGNAIYHATGKRLRELPMTPDRVMRSELPTLATSENI
jgi:xanthine dehydrogenase YagR molybdenum-binding subunit